MVEASEDDIEIQTERPKLEKGVVESAPVLAEPSGLDDPLRPRDGRDLVWKDVNMTLDFKGEKESKKLLDGVWGEVPKRQVTAIMGPSGSGKVCR
jgi:ABC-type multidrug transport system fused ATPase/permease subunit